MKNRPRDDREIYWNLRELLYERNIRRPQDFKDMLEEHGLKMSYAACHDLMHTQPVRVTLRVILTIVKMLNCSVNDLIVVRRGGAKPVGTTEPPKPRKVIPLTRHQKKVTGERLEF